MKNQPFHSLQKIFGPLSYWQASSGPHTQFTVNLRTEQTRGTALQSFPLVAAQAVAAFLFLIPPFHWNDTTIRLARYLTWVKKKMHQAKREALLVVNCAMQHICPGPAGQAREHNSSCSHWRCCLQQETSSQSRGNHFPMP